MPGRLHRTITGWPGRSRDATISGHPHAGAIVSGDQEPATHETLEREVAAEASQRTSGTQFCSRVRNGRSQTDVASRFRKDQQAISDGGRGSQSGADHEKPVRQRQTTANGGCFGGSLCPDRRVPVDASFGTSRSGTPILHEQISKTTLPIPCQIDLTRQQQKSNLLQRAATMPQRKQIPTTRYWMLHSPG